jgi:hypothetical protein
MPRKQNQVDSSTVRKSDSHKTDANHGKIVNKDFSCKHSNKVCNLCVASSVRMSATSQKELFTKSGRYGVAVSSGRCRQRMGWRWRKRGVTLLSTVPQKSSYRYAKSEFHGIKSHTSYTASGIDDAETSEAKCMIVDLAGDSEMDQSDNSSSFSAGLACCSDAKNTQMTSHAKRKSNKNTKLSVQQSVRNSASDMCVKACQGKAAAVLQNNSFSEDFVLLDSSDEVESVSSESIIAVEEDDESESTLVNPSCLRIDRNQQ